MKPEFYYDLYNLFNYMINNDKDIVEAGIDIRDLDYLHGMIQARVGQLEAGEQLPPSDDDLIVGLNTILDSIDKPNQAAEKFQKNLNQILTFYGCRMTRQIG